MNTLVSLPILAAMPTTAPAMPPTAGDPDPIFAAIDAHRQADAACIAVPRGGNIPDELADRCGEAFHAVMRTHPTTPAGLAALTDWAREEAHRLRKDGSMLYADDLYALTATINDATRGMSGLQPWSPPASAPVGPHPDKELFAAADRYLVALSEYAAGALTFGEVEFVEPRPRGYVSKERAYLRSMKHFGEMESELAGIRAKTWDGMIAKARALEADRGVSDDLRESVLDDLFRMKPSHEESGAQALALTGRDRSKQRKETGNAKSK